MNKLSVSGQEVEYTIPCTKNASLANSGKFKTYSQTLTICLKQPVVAFFQWKKSTLWLEPFSIFYYTTLGHDTVSTKKLQHTNAKTES